MNGPELTAVLESTLGRPVVALARRPSPYRSSFEIERLEVLLEGGRRLAGVLKDVSLGALTKGAKPSFIVDPAREIAAYREVLGPAGIDAPACYAATADARSGRFWLLLEAVEGDLLWQVGEADVWIQAARWLADLHGRRVPRAGSDGLLHYDADYFRIWLRRALAFGPREPLRRLAGRYDCVVERLVGLPRCFVHGEFYPSNVLVERRNGTIRVRPVDWEMAGIGPGLLDLAALTAGGWSEAERERLVRAYHDRWPAAAPRPDWAELLDSLEHCRLHLALQWLGWSPHWSPPEQHRQDWLAAALRAAERIGL